MGRAPRLERVWGTEGASGNLRAIRISGTIMTDAADGALLSSGTYGYEVADQLDSLKTDQVDGVVLLVNTPGGTITGSKAIADAITRYRERTGKPVLVHVEGSSTSGGVYSTATANEIIADHGSMIGSIGVILGPLPRYKDVSRREHPAAAGDHHHGRHQSGVHHRGQWKRPEQPVPGSDRAGTPAAPGDGR